jgi:hypothetical protein
MRAGKDNAVALLAREAADESGQSESFCGVLDRCLRGKAQLMAERLMRCYEEFRDCALIHFVRTIVSLGDAAVRLR